VSMCRGDERRAVCGVRARLRRWIRCLDFVYSYLRANLAMELEYRASFVSQVFSMIINDAAWVLFWLLYFSRFPVVKGWGRREVITLWAIFAVSYSLSRVLCANVDRLAGLIYRGQLDVYLTQPKKVLTHVLISRTRPSALGDGAFGLTLFFLFLQPTPARTLLFIFCAVAGAVIFTSYSVIAHSLAFYMGSSEMLAAELTNSFLHFASYPTAIFRGWVRFLLFTLLPAGFINYMPVGLMRDFSWAFFAAVSGAAVLSALAASFVFYRGLRRYESGNLMTVRL